MVWKVKQKILPPNVVASSRCTSIRLPLLPAVNPTDQDLQSNLVTPASGSSPPSHCSTHSSVLPKTPPPAKLNQQTMANFPVRPFAFAPVGSFVELEAQQAQNDAAWHAELPVEPQAQANGWRAWPVIPPPYIGFSFRRFFEYDGPSLMDGVQQEHNDIENLSDVWSEYSQVKELADNFINGLPAARFAFVRAGGAAVSLLVMADAELLRWIGGMLKRIYTKTIMPSVCPEGTIFPLNLFAQIQLQLNSSSSMILMSIKPEYDVFIHAFRTSLDLGFVVGRMAILCMRQISAASPPLSCIPPGKHHLQL